MKKVARQLSGRIRAILTVDWQKTTQARARVENTFDEGLPRADTQDVFQVKKQVGLPSRK